jgi:hypothetical protein
LKCIKQVVLYLEGKASGKVSKCHLIDLWENLPEVGVFALEFPGSVFTRPLEGANLSFMLS